MTERDDVHFVAAYDDEGSAPSEFTQIIAG